MGNRVHIPDQGNLSIAPDASAPLLVVFGGIDVNEVQSGVYMWNYMHQIKTRYHIFVANSNAVNGAHAYRALTKTLGEKGLTPSTQILYLFSGGYRPGMDLLPGDGASLFSWIYLVDIWMGVGKSKSSVVPDFYKKLVDANASKITYIYTAGGADNDAARDYIAKKVTGIHHKGSHMSTNVVAVGRLP